MNTTTNKFADRYNDLMEDVRLEIESLVQKHADGKEFSFEDNGFEDDSHNDVAGVNLEDVLLADGETYSLHELSFWDGIKIIDTILQMTTKVNQ